MCTVKSGSFFTCNGSLVGFLAEASSIIQESFRCLCLQNSVFPRCRKCFGYARRAGRRILRQSLFPILFPQGFPKQRGTIPRIVPPSGIRSRKTIKCRYAKPTGLRPKRCLSLSFFILLYRSGRRKAIRLMEKEKNQDRFYLDFLLHFGQSERKNV